MAYKATQDVVRRVMPLLDQLATRSIDKARLLQYLSATAAVDWGIMRVTDDKERDGARVITYRDSMTGDEHNLQYPEMLPADLEPLVVAEYKRLAVDKPLTKMDKRLFERFFGRTHCSHCRYRGPEHEQIHSECHFAGHPINYDPD